MRSGIIDLRMDPELLPCARGGHPSVIEGAREKTISDLSDLFREGLLQGKVLVDPEGISHGIILYGLIGDSLCNLSGENILHIFCLEVREPIRRHNNGKKLIQTATQDYPEGSVRGISTSSYGEFWMPESYFRKLGFNVFHKQGVLSQMFKPLAENATPPTVLTLKLPPSDMSTVVDHFQGFSYCPFGKSFEQRILTILSEFPDIAIREHAIRTRQDVLRFGTTPVRVFINGQEPTDDPTISDSELREKIRNLIPP